MPKQYEQEAIELCRTLYCKYGGRNYDRIEEEMVEAGYVGWSKQLLFTKGRGRNFREGWIERYGFDKSQAEYLKTQIEGVVDDPSKLYLEIKAVREKLGEKVKNGNGSRDEIFAHRDYCKLEIEARKWLDLAKDNYEVFVLVWEKILAWLPELSEPATLELLAVAELLLERARREYGEKEQSVA